MKDTNKLNDYFENGTAMYVSNVILGCIVNPLVMHNFLKYFEIKSSITGRFIVEFLLNFQMTLLNFQNDIKNNT